MKGIKGSLKERIALLRLKQGDSEAYGYIYDVYAEKIYRYIYFRVSDKGVAHDLTQDVFLDTWEKIMDGEMVSRVQSFLYRVAYHKVVDFYRSKDRQAALLDDIPESAIGQNQKDDSRADVTILRKHIASLRDEYQDVIILKHVEGLSIREIADIIDKEETAVRVQLYRAMQELKDKHKISHDSSNHSETEGTS